jgi:hypothetical protein
VQNPATSSKAVRREPALLGMFASLRGRPAAGRHLPSPAEQSQGPRCLTGASIKSDLQRFRRRSTRRGQRALSGRAGICGRGRHVLTLRSAHIPHPGRPRRRAARA